MYDAKEEFNLIRYSEKLTAKSRLLQTKANVVRCGLPLQVQHEVGFLS